LRVRALSSVLPPPCRQWENEFCSRDQIIRELRDDRVEGCVSKTATAGWSYFQPYRPGDRIGRRRPLSVRAVAAIERFFDVMIGWPVLCGYCRHRGEPAQPGDHPGGAAGLVYVIQDGGPFSSPTLSARDKCDLDARYRRWDGPGKIQKRWPTCRLTRFPRKRRCDRRPRPGPRRAASAISRSRTQFRREGIDDGAPASGVGSRR